MKESWWETIRKLKEATAEIERMTADLKAPPPDQITVSREDLRLSLSRAPIFHKGESKLAWQVAEARKRLKATLDHTPQS
jgi:hypothetical protein